MLVEAGEQTRQIVQVRTHHVRRAFTGDDRQGFFKLQQTGRQLGFALFGDDHRRRRQRAFIDIRFAEHGEHAGIGILHIRRGIALKGQHVIPVEDIVSGAVF